MIFGMLNSEKIWHR